MNTDAPPAARIAIRITVDAALLAQARALQIDISLASQAGLERAIAAHQAQRWLQDNQAALDSSNDWVDRHGLPLAHHRNF